MKVYEEYDIETFGKAKGVALTIRNHGTNRFMVILEMATETINFRVTVLGADVMTAVNNALHSNR
jgi:hypothetical protein